MKSPALKVLVTALMAIGATAPAALAADAPRPSGQKTAPAAQVYVVKGFRSAHFGMSRDQLLAAIRQDFKLAPSAISEASDAALGTTALVVKLDALVPGPGPATLTYVLDQKSQRLTHVNVVWLVDAPQRAAIVPAGLKMVDYFQGYAWSGGLTATALAVGPNSVVMFVGKDAQGAAVEVRADGVAFSNAINGENVASPAPTGPARLRIAYASSVTTPAATLLVQGDF